MMQMEMMPTQPADFPSAILLARLKDVLMDNNILHRMVRPTEEGTEVISVNRLVNVVPFRRIYRFDRKDELKDFCDELLRRPLVLQPVVHFGRGLGKGSLACGLCYKDDKWVMLINQTHPKVLSRLQVGLDAAKNAMAKGQSFEIKFAFSKMVEKIYKESLTKTEQENAARALDLVKTYFRYAEWEYGDLIIRFHGYAAMMGRGGGLFEMKTLNLTFHFEDLLYQEISWKTLEAACSPKPHLSPITEDEIRESLPAWTVNGVSPLEDIGDQVPAANYSYAQAGRLYESFRKKKRRPRAEMGDHAEGGASPGVRPSVNDGIELRVPDDEDVDQWQQQRGYGEDYQDGRHGYHTGATPPAAGYSGQGFYPSVSAYPQDSNPVDDGFYEEKGAKPKRGPKYDTHGHIYPEIRVNAGKPHSPPGTNLYPSAPPMENQSPYPNAHPPRSPGPYGNASSPNPYANAPPAQSHSPYTNINPAKSPSPYANTSPQSPGQAPYARPSPTQENGDYTPLREQFTRLHMQQGSDRSSRSETGSAVADSGICSDSDGHVREGSYDNAPYQKHSPPHRYAMDNHAFQHEETDVSEAMRKHKELIAEMMGGAPPPPQADPGYHDSRQQRHTSQSTDKYSDGYYGNRNGPLPSPYAKSGTPSPRSPNGHYDYSGVHYSQTNGYGGNMHGNRQQVDESFI